MAEPRTRLYRQINAGLCLLILAALLYGLFPGRFDTDSRWMYDQSAAPGAINDWHSPLLTVFMGAARHVVPGPAGPFTVQVCLWCLGLFLISDALIATGRRRAGLAVTLACATPLVSFLLVEANKDAAMAAAGLMLIGLLVRAAVAPLRPGLAAHLVFGALLVIMVGLRLNAVVAAAPLLAAWLVVGGGGLKLRTGFALVGALVALVAADQGIEYGLIHARQMHIVRALAAFDLAGIDAHSADPVGMEVLGPGFPARARVCYTPEAHDPFEWGPCKDVGAALAILSETAPGRALLYRTWSLAILAHPAAYAQHRLAHFGRLMRIGCDCAGAMTRGVTPARKTRLVPVERVAPLGVVMERAAKAVYFSDLARGWLWAAALAACLAALAVRGRDGPDALAVAAAGVAASGLLYPLALLVIGVAAAQRYVHWTIMLAAIAIPMTLAVMLRPRHPA